MRWNVGYREGEPYAEWTLGDGVTVGAWGDSLLSAFANAAKVAKGVADNPLLQSVLPPPVGPALRAASALANAAERGQLAELLPKLRGPGARRLALQLQRMRRARRPATFTRDYRGQ